MELREAVAKELNRWRLHPVTSEMGASYEMADRILSLLQGDVARRERGAFVAGAMKGYAIHLAGNGPCDEMAEAEALRRYPEGRQQHGKAK